MEREKLAFVATCDLAGQVRGKGFPLADFAARLRKGVGFTPSNIMMSAFGPIYASPFGTRGDLMLVPDPETRVDVEFETGLAERFFLGDLCTLDGEAWECCPRHFLRRGLKILRSETGLTLLAAFEQEFVYTGVEHRPSATYGLDLFRRQGGFGEILLGAMRTAGISPDSFLPEYGPRQFEVTVAPKVGMRAADEAVIVRELARATAHRLGHRAVFAPMLVPDGIGNGTHVHFSLCDGSGRPVLADPFNPCGLSSVGAHFVAGLLHHLPAMTALTAPSVASYYRLTPNRWAPTHADLGEHDRGAALRICPVFLAESAEAAAAQFNVEYRVADATACPYVVLGVLVHAGLDGIRRKLALPALAGSMEDTAREGAGFRPLPDSLAAALEELAGHAAARSWLGATLHDAYLQLKHSELQELDGLEPSEICDRYVDAY